MSIESERKMTTGDSTANKEFKKEIIETHSAQETFALGQRIGLEAVSYTHLDVYKRQDHEDPEAVRI